MPNLIKSDDKNKLKQQYEQSTNSSQYEIIVLVYATEVHHLHHPLPPSSGRYMRAYALMWPLYT